jgi:glutathione S-transferase
MIQIIPQVKNPVRLITIPVSHYCEKIRWALTRSQIPFVEEPHMPPFHRFATRQAARQQDPASIAEAEKHLSSINRFVSRLVGGQSVPVLITATSIFNDSEEILKHIDDIAADDAKLYPIDREHRQQVEELVKSFDTILAPAVRLWFYFYTFDRSELIQPLWCQGVPLFERVLFPLVFSWMRSNVFQMYTIDDKSATVAYSNICKIFETVDSLLADGRTYLVGDRFSAADLTFATIAAGAIIPAGYGIKMPELSDLPSPMVANIQALRGTLAGKFVLNLYQQHEHLV